MIKKSVRRFFDWVLREDPMDYPGYEETGLSEQEWNTLSREEKMRYIK